jgi:hypothetical protein
MRHLFNKASLVIIAISILLIGLSAITGCRETPTLPYAPIQLAPPPVELSLERVYQDYMADVKDAEENYSGERFLFRGLLVDDVESYFLNSRAFDISITVGNVRFKPRYEYDFDEILPGFVVDVTGVPRSLFMDRILIVTDCLVYIVEGYDFERPQGY